MTKFYQVTVDSTRYDPALKRNVERTFSTQVCAKDAQEAIQFMKTPPSFIFGEPVHITYRAEEVA